MSRGLYIGRFQPYHNGHNKILQEILEEIDEMIIGIGSSQKSHTLKDPFTCGERIEMVKKATENFNKVKYIIPYQDISYNSLWVSYIISTSPKFDVVYSNNPLVVQLFTENNINVKNTKMYDRNNLSGTNIRRLIYNNNPYLKSYVPEKVINFINNINGFERIKNIVKNDIK